MLFVKLIALLLRRVIQVKSQCIAKRSHIAFDCAEQLLCSYNLINNGTLDYLDAHVLSASGRRHFCLP